MLHNFMLAPLHTVTQFALSCGIGLSGVLPVQHGYSMLAFSFHSLQLIRYNPLRNWHNHSNGDLACRLR
jgi:hypothetical protein